MQSDEVIFKFYQFHKGHQAWSCYLYYIRPLKVWIEVLEAFTQHQPNVVQIFSFI